MSEETVERDMSVARDLQEIKEVVKGQLANLKKYSELFGKHTPQEGIVYPTKQQLESLFEKMKDLFRFYEALIISSKKKTSKYTGFSCPKFSTPELAKFIMDSGVFGDLVKTFDSEFKGIIVNGTLIEKFLTYYIMNNQLLLTSGDTDTSLDGMIKCDNAMIALLKVRYPKFGTKSFDYSDFGTDVSLAKDEDEKEIICVKSKFFRSYVKKELITKLGPVQFLPKHEEKLAEMRKILMKEIGTRIKQPIKIENHLEVLSFDDFVKKMSEVRQEIINIKFMYYPKSIKKFTYNKLQIPQKNKFVKVGKLIYEIQRDYEIKWKETHKVKRETKSGLNKVISIPKSLGLMLHLDKIGFPEKNGRFCIKSTTITSLFPLYVEQKKLVKGLEEQITKSGKKRNVQIFAADDEMLRCFSLYLKGTTKKGDEFNIDPSKFSYTNIHQPLSLMKEEVTDKKLIEETEALTVEVMKQRAQQKVLALEIKRLKAALIKTQTQIDLAKNLKDKNSTKGYEGELKSLESKTKELIAEHKEISSKLFF